MLARGDSFNHMLSMVILSVLTFGMMFMGGYLDGVRGIIWGFAMTNAVYYLALGMLIRKTKTWMPWIDLMFMAACGAFILLGKLATGMRIF